MLSTCTINAITIYIYGFLHFIGQSVCLDHIDLRMSSMSVNVYIIGAVFFEADRVSMGPRGVKGMKGVLGDTGYDGARGLKGEILLLNKYQYSSSKTFPANSLVNLTPCF